MYTTEILLKGLRRLKITDLDTIYYLNATRYWNKRLMAETKEKRRAQRAWDNRHSVQPGLTKKEYKALMEINDKILLELKELLRKDPADIDVKKEFEGYLKKDKVLSFYIKGNAQTQLNIAGAKLYPIPQLIKVDRSGFAKCIWHSEKSGSMKYYPKDNRVHCFGCGKRGDAIDVCMEVNKLTINQAIAFLCGTQS